MGGATVAAGQLENAMITQDGWYGRESWVVVRPAGNGLKDFRCNGLIAFCPSKSLVRKVKIRAAIVNKWKVILRLHN